MQVVLRVHRTRGDRSNCGESLPVFGGHDCARLERWLQNVATQDRNYPVTVAPIRHPKPNTWYYGVRCACSRVLVVCEDLFAGKGAEDFLQAPPGFHVQCECGTVNQVARFQKFKTPE